MARALWKGAVSFGLVNLPVELYPAEDRKLFAFSMLDRKDLSPVGYRRFNESTGKGVAWGDIVKGYEYGKDEYVVLTDEDFRRANVKTTQTIDIRAFVDAGGKGLHVVLPIRTTLTWDEARSFSKSVAGFMVRTFPDRFVATISKAKRDGKILIDYLRNADGATAIAPYAARANAPVATPTHWSELDRDVRGDHFNVGNVRERLASMKDDPWADFLSVRQSITAAMRARLS